MSLPPPPPPLFLLPSLLPPLPIFLLPSEQQANCSQGQQGHKTSGELRINLKASQMAVVPQGRETSRAS
jgi:hypothetical protein